MVGSPGLLRQICPLALATRQKKWGDGKRCRQTGWEAVGDSCLGVGGIWAGERPASLFGPL